MTIYRGMGDSDIKVKNEDGEYENININSWPLNVEDFDSETIDSDLWDASNFEMKSGSLSGFFDVDINIDISVLYFSKDYLIYEMNAGDHTSLNALKKNEKDNLKEIDLEDLPNKVKQSVGKELL